MPETMSYETQKCKRIIKRGETEDGRKFRQNRVPLVTKAKSSTHNRSASIFHFPEPGDSACAERNATASDQNRGVLRGQLYRCWTVQRSSMQYKKVM